LLDIETAENKKFDHKSPLVRIAILVAGAVMNIILAFIIFFGIFFFIGIPNETATFINVKEGMPAETAGLTNNDQIKMINDTMVYTFTDISNVLNNISNSEEVTITYIDDISKTEKITYVTPTIDNDKLIIGITPASDMYDPINSLILSTTTTVSIIGSVFTNVFSLITGQVSVNQLAGPIGIFTISSQAVDNGFQTVLYLIAFLSINIGIFNLLPIPALDGGRILLIIIEILKGRPISKKSQEKAIT